MSIKKIFYFIFFFAMLSSCQTSKELKSTSYNRSLQNYGFTDEELFSVGIDTNAIYKFHSFWVGSYNFNTETKKNYSLVGEVKDIYGRKSNSIETIKFDSNGKVDFYFTNATILKDELFTSKNELTGIYDIHNKMIHIKRKLMIGHTQQLVRGKIKINGDTLHMIEKWAPLVHHKLYIRAN